MKPTLHCTKLKSNMKNEFVGAKRPRIVFVTQYNF